MPVEWSALDSTDRQGPPLRLGRLGKLRFRPCCCDAKRYPRGNKALFYIVQPIPEECLSTSGAKLIGAPPAAGRRDSATVSLRPLVPSEAHIQCIAAIIAARITPATNTSNTRKRKSGGAALWLFAQSITRHNT